MKENQEATERVQKAQEGRDVARKEEQALRKERDKAIEESLRARLDKELLEKKVEHLEKKCRRLSRVRYGWLGCPPGAVDAFLLNSHWTQSGKWNNWTRSASPAA